MLFLSGAAGLVYQVLWMRQLGLLFGNTAEAASVTLAAFFAGLALGSHFWGGRVSRSAHPLRLYAWLEVGIAVTALVYYGTLSLFYAAYPYFYQSVATPEGPGLAALGLKLGIAAVLIFPPAFCMGGTLPAVGQLLIRRRSAFGPISALVYGVNTLGAAVGVIITVFALVPWLGFNASYAVAIVMSLGVGGAAWWLASSEDRPPVEGDLPSTAEAESEAPAEGEAGLFTGTRGRWLIGLLCFGSGFGVLALEVVWTRLLAQVHENSVYGFAIVLAVVLVGLALGAGWSAMLARRNRTPASTLSFLVLLAGAALVMAPSLFMTATNGLEPLSKLESWSQHLGRTIGLGLMAIGPVVFLLGTVFPFIMKVEERYADRPGRALGRLLAVNTLGAILGALLCGFVLLPMLGSWETVRWTAVGYLVLAVLVAPGVKPMALGYRGAALVLIVLAWTVLDPSGLPTTGRRAGSRVERMLATWEGSSSTVAVVEDREGNLTIKINSGYSLGSTSPPAVRKQVNQAQIPLHIYPETKKIFFLGLGTGISAGAALDEQFEHVERVVSCELDPLVVKAAREFIPSELTGELFTDPRAEIRVADGRHYLKVTDETFDMINADLFLPYRRGAGSLYSLDHYRVARERLAPGGVYVQWLPMFQLTRSEFGIIARTMMEAFGEVTMWRNNFAPGYESVALIGRVEPGPIPALPTGDGTDRQAMLEAVADLAWRDAVPGMAVPSAKAIPFYYAGNLTEVSELFADYPINTDDRPLIEYQTPRTFRENVGQKVIWFVGPKLADLIDTLFERCPPATDPVLARRSAANRGLALAGVAYHRAMIFKALGEIARSQAQWRIFQRRWREAAD
ncbi:MAG: fused MFS/spermidine synthase [Phycisphaeraceae bacterium]|nr:fused MFS/spermidine synthase [Phycisphaeraceae bacterium]